MSIKEVIDNLKFLLDSNYVDSFEDKENESLEMAIKLLKSAIYRFIEQSKMKKVDTQYDAGIVCVKDGNYIIGYEMQGAAETFSIGQPVYDKDNNIMGWLGIGLYKNLYYTAENINVPCEYWQICSPTKFCETGKQVYTYWQMLERSKNE